MTGTYVAVATVSLRVTDKHSKLDTQQAVAQLVQVSCCHYAAVTNAPHSTVFYFNSSSTYGVSNYHGCLLLLIL